VVGAGEAAAPVTNAPDGPAAALVADCPAQLECGTRGLLDSLPIKVVDAYGNLAEGCALEVRRYGNVTLCVVL
jgi:hypothetical protein